MSPSKSANLSTGLEPGVQVKVATRTSLGHCRTPVYLRGKTGTVIAIAGRFRNPEQLAYHKPGLPLHVLYRVRFDQNAVWSNYSGTAADDLEADIFEHWLEPISTERQP